ncbi:MAG TPA: hypothetical protein VMJ10_28885 [Kofleriaceae bacterium]|nr:hypothetical protein [Kofleriaceae bacterium]
MKLGTVIAPSGSILIVDPGFLGMWSHDRPPVMPEGILSEKGTAAANRSVDAAIVGADSDKAGQQLGQQWNPRFICDVPRELANQFADQVKQIARAQQLDARLEILHDRVPHRTRADHALSFGTRAGEVQFHGMWAGVLSDVATNELHVIGERMPADSPDATRLRRISVVVRDGVTARSERFAHAVVDWARLLVVDLDAIGIWQHEQPLDGLADFVFRGIDAPAVAQRFKAAELEPGEFGWPSRP